jgi:hypothetical protein
MIIASICSIRSITQFPMLLKIGEGEKHSPSLYVEVQKPDQNPNAKQGSFEGGRRKMT